MRSRSKARRAPRATHNTSFVCKYEGPRRRHVFIHGVVRASSSSSSSSAIGHWRPDSEVGPCDWKQGRLFTEADLLLCEVGAVFDSAHFWIRRTEGDIPWLQVILRTIWLNDESMHQILTNSSGSLMYRIRQFTGFINSPGSSIHRVRQFTGFINSPGSSCWIHWCSSIHRVHQFTGFVFKFTGLCQFTGFINSTGFVICIHMGSSHLILGSSVHRVESRDVHQFTGVHQIKPG